MLTPLLPGVTAVAVAADADDGDAFLWRNSVATSVAGAEAAVYLDQRPSALLALLTTKQRVTQRMIELGVGDRVRVGSCCYLDALLL